MTTYRDGSGRTIGTGTTYSGTTMPRDGSGRTTGTAGPSSTGLSAWYGACTDNVERPDMNPNPPKARQSLRIREINEALEACRIYSLDHKAAVLALPRSTTHTIVCAQHKSTGISAKILAQMLNSPKLPLPVRAKIEEYAGEEASGGYGNTTGQQRKFCAALQQRAA